MEIKQLVFVAIFSVSLVALLASSNSFSAESLFDLSSDLPATKTTTIKVTGEAYKNLEPDSVIVRLEANSDSSKGIGDVIATQKEIVRELTNAIEQASDKETLVVHQLDRSRIYTEQQRIADPEQSSYEANFRVKVASSFDDFSTLADSFTEKGFSIDDVRISKVPEKMEKNNAPSNTARVTVTEGSSIPGCEETLLCYSPHTLTVKPGTTVTWTNADNAAHTVTSGFPEDGPDGLFDSGLFMAQESFSYTFLQSGGYHYFCMVHPWMTGVVDVSGDSVKPAAMKTVVEFYAFKRLPPDYLQQTIDKYQQTASDFDSIIARHGLDEGDVQKRPIKLREDFRGYSEPDLFRSRDTILVQSTSDQLDKIIQVASNKHAQIEHISAAYSDSALNNVRNELTQEALDDAKAKVLEIIDGTGNTIQGIKSIEVNTSSMIDKRYDGTLKSGVIINSDSSFIHPEPIYTKVQVEFEVGR